MAQKTLNWDRPLQTKGGRPVRILATDFDFPDYPIVAAVKGPVGEEIHLYNKLGSPQSRLKDDVLINVPEKVKFYVNIYQRGRRVFVGTHTYSSAEEASVVFDREYVKTIEVEVEV